MSLLKKPTQQTPTYNAWTLPNNVTANPSHGLIDPRERGHATIPESSELFYSRRVGHLLPAQRWLGRSLAHWRVRMRPVRLHTAV